MAHMGLKASATCFRAGILWVSHFIPHNVFSDLRDEAQTAKKKVPHGTNLQNVRKLPPRNKPLHLYYLRVRGFEK